MYCKYCICVYYTSNTENIPLPVYNAIFSSLQPRIYSVISIYEPLASESLQVAEAYPLADGDFSQPPISTYWKGQNCSYQHRQLATANNLLAPLVVSCWRLLYILPPYPSFHLFAIVLTLTEYHTLFAGNLKCSAKKLYVNKGLFLF